MNLADQTLKHRVAVLRWVLPISFAALAAVYEFGLARWVHDTFGDLIHFGVEVLFFGTAGPLLTFWALTLIHGWLDQKEQVERQAHITERRLASITTFSADAILSLDTAGRIEAWNLGAELLFGYAADQMRGRSFTALLGSDGKSEQEFEWLVDTVREAGFVRSYETTCHDANSRAIIVELTATQLVDEMERPLGMSIILRDITQRRYREEEIRRLNASLNEQVAERTRELAQKVEELSRANADLQKLDRMRSEFVSLVSHQIRAPLTNMRGAVDHMQLNCATINGTCARMFTIFDQQTERLDHLVQDVLSATRIEAGDLLLHPEPISLLPVAQQVVEQTRVRAVGRVFRVPATKPGLPLVYADRERISEVLANLLDNADKYSPPGKEVIVDVRADQCEVTLTVRDFGSGLPEGNLDRIFEKFYRIDNSDSQAVYGYGLGLYICRRLVELHGGRIWAENHPNGGAIFSVALPQAT